LVLRLLLVVRGVVAPGMAVRRMVVLGMVVRGLRASLRSVSQVKREQLHYPFGCCTTVFWFCKTMRLASGEALVAS
jgi:hypothetical protein